MRGYESFNSFSASSKFGTLTELYSALAPVRRNCIPDSTLPPTMRTPWRAPDLRKCACTRSISAATSAGPGLNSVISVTTSYPRRSRFVASIVSSPHFLISASEKNPTSVT